MSNTTNRGSVVVLFHVIIFEFLQLLLSQKDKIHLTNVCLTFEAIKYPIDNTISNHTFSKLNFPTLHFFLGIAFSIFKRQK